LDTLVTSDAIATTRATAPRTVRTSSMMRSPGRRIVRSTRPFYFETGWPRVSVIAALRVAAAR
jgi:hypothetical protein